MQANIALLSEIPISENRVHLDNEECIYTQRNLSNNLKHLYTSIPLINMNGVEYVQYHLVFFHYNLVWTNLKKNHFKKNDHTCTTTLVISEFSCDIHVKQNHSQIKTEILHE